MTVSIVHLSDLHFYNETSRFEALARFINTNFPDAYVAITGDITDDGLKEQYVLAGRVLGPWISQGRLLVVPGNHDCGLAGNSFDKGSWARFYRTFRSCLGSSSSMPWLRMIEHVAIIGMDTTYASKGTGWARGAIGSEQMKVFTRLLDNPAVMGRALMVLMHHHPYDKGKLRELVDAEEFRQTLRRGRKGRKTVVLYGHRHDSDSFDQGPIRYIEAPPSADPRGADRRMVFRVVHLDANHRIRVQLKRAPLT